MTVINEQELILYRGLRAEPLLLPLFGRTELAAFYAALSERALAEGWQGNVFLLCLVDALLTADNAFSRAAALNHLEDAPPALFRLAERELAFLQQAAERPLPGSEDWQDLAANFPLLSAQRRYSQDYTAILYQLAKEFFTLSPQEIGSCLANFHARFGCGVLARYNFLEWRANSLCGVVNADPIRPGDLFSYERQKKQVLEHTAAFVSGKPAGNMLLYGERGTGKSSLVKAAVNHFSAQGLRLLYVPRPVWGKLTDILATLSVYRQKFIVFMDDFSFDPTDEDYKQIKSIIEGGAALTPPNAVIYATSNRRHVVAESWADREGKEEEMHVADAAAEKLALADRFSQTVTFLPPTQHEYLAIVAGLAKRSGLIMPPDELFAEAVRWERWHNVRSGRTARQFIDHLLCK